MNESFIGRKVLITTDNWFFAPDGRQYRAVWGKVVGIFDDKETLGITTNRNSSNWFVQVGNMVVAGCQIHYAMLTDEEPSEKSVYTSEHEGKVVESETNSQIYRAAG